MREEHFHYNARIIADSYPEHTRIVRDAFGARVAISPTERSHRGVPFDGIDAGEFNKQLRLALRSRDNLGMRYECVERGGFFASDAGTQGFDFAYIDEAFNTVAYRNRCRGPVAFHEGERLWASSERERNKIRELDPGHAVYSAPRGTLVTEARTAPVILGEIQFGNWALLYYDLFKALSALESAALDLYIYVCPTGKLQSLVSAGTVNFTDTRQVLDEKSNVLRFPIWLIGLDIDDVG